MKIAIARVLLQMMYCEYTVASTQPMTDIASKCLFLLKICSSQGLHEVPRKCRAVATYGILCTRNGIAGTDYLQ